MAAKPFKIICGDTEGFLWPSRFGPAGKSQCIKLEKSDSSWMTPIEFEKHAGKGAQHNWKRTVRSVFHNNRMLYYLIDEGILKTCQDPKHCKCSNCNTVNCKASKKEKSDKVPDKSTQDTDSDSGISIEVSSVSEEVKEEPFTTQEQDKELPNYTMMVQEAIYALSNEEGCSLLGIFLYILKHYPQEEHVTVMNRKIKSALALLKRMGVINATNEEADELEETIVNENTTKATKKNGGKENASNNQVYNARPIINRKKLSPALAALLGKKKLARREAVRDIWIYIKKHKLQDPKQRTIIVCDDKLKAVTKKKKVTCSEILTCLGQHMTAI